MSVPGTATAVGEAAGQERADQVLAGLGDHVVAQIWVVVDLRGVLALVAVEKTGDPVELRVRRRCCRRTSWTKLFCTSVKSPGRRCPRVRRDCRVDDVVEARVVGRACWSRDRYACWSQPHRTEVPVGLDRRQDERVAARVVQPVAVAEDPSETFDNVLQESTCR